DMLGRRPRRRIRDRARIRRSLSIVPSLFTIGNIFCGYYSIVATLRGNWDYAAVLIGIGYILDGLDGRVARLTKTTSDFGLQLDSIADVITFGVAPGILAFNWGFGASEGIDGSVAKHVHQLGSLATFAFVVCGALRLARFNLQAKLPPETTSKRYFVGLPIPAAAGMIASIVHFFKTPTLMVGSALLWSFLILLLAFLMISTVRYYSFKEFDVKKARPSLALFGTAMLISLIYLYSEVMLLAIAAVYVTSGLILNLTHTVRRFLPSSVNRSEPAHGNIKS
ncbi:MAG TPA: CDP-diacylglycerol--serine O-phosphatidyltransferase, partial [Terriglobia bacterium]|nr:CDP-diacylglycerol--serine O-phosphatidyltransferase [Terriglobia bacterium]